MTGEAPAHYKAAVKPQGYTATVVDWLRPTVNLVGTPAQFRCWLLRTSCWTSIGFVDVSRVKVLDV